jgi:hypothetical protein
MFDRGTVEVEMHVLWFVSLWGLPEAHACSCTDEGGFLQVVDRSHTVVSGTVAAHQGAALPLFMTVEVDRVLQGEAREVIRVFGDDGALCRPYVTTFDVGERFVWALSPDGDDFSVSVCGTYWLTVEDDVAVGRLRSEIDSIALDDLDDRLGGGVLTTGCQTAPGLAWLWLPMLPLVARRRR